MIFRLTMHKRIFGLSISFILCLVFWIIYHWYISSPWMIMRRVIQAIIEKDYITLCRLSEDEELRRLNITPQIVAQIFHDTIGSDPFPPVVVVKLVEPPMSNQMTWDIVFEGDPPYDPHYPYLSVQLLYTKHGWRLLLSKLLYGLCIYRMVKSGHNYEQTLTPCLKFLERNGIKGLRREDGGFDIFSKGGTEW
jgi:hypothetical protein